MPDMPDTETRPDPATPASPAPRAAAAPPPDDPVARLKKMSTTAGVGSQEYVAINPLAIVTVLAGVASVLAFLADVLLVIPLVAVICGVVAWRQVRDSNGTQTGTGLAALGMLLALLLGGGMLGNKVLTSWRHHAEEGPVSATIQHLGELLSQRKFDAVYDQMFSERFRARVDREAFKTRWEYLTQAGNLGEVKSVKWNGRAVFDEEGGHMAVWAGSLAQFERPTETPPRWQFRMSKIDGQWLIDDLPEVFPPQQRRRGQR